MNKLLVLSLSVFLLAGCGETNEAPNEPNDMESQFDQESIEINKKVTINLKSGVEESDDPSYYIAPSDSENYINISGYSINGEDVKVFYQDTVIDVIKVDESGNFEYRSQADDDPALIYLTTDSTLVDGEDVIVENLTDKPVIVNSMPNDTKEKEISEENFSESETTEEVMSSEEISTEKPSSEVTSTGEVPREHKNALKSANQYLNYTSFSKIGLYDQLLFEKYSEDAAQYAIDNVKTNWNENALQTAIDYLDYTSFSDAGLYDQLIFEGYTSEQAQYAINNLE